MENLIKALKIFLKYANPTYPTHCEHDTLYVCISPDLITDSKDLEELKVLGFSPNDNDGFTSFRYGSC